MFERFHKSEQTGRKAPRDIVAVDMGHSATKVLRLRLEKEEYALVAADLYEPVLGGANPSEDGGESFSVGGLGKSYRSSYAAMALSSNKAVVRLISLPTQLQASQAIESHLRDHAGLEGDYRLSYATLPDAPKTRGKSETKFLAVALPEEEARHALSFAATGSPAPYSLELAGLGVMNAFMLGPSLQHPDDGVAMVEAGARVTYLALFSKGQLALVRKFDFGCEALLEKVQETMGVDRDVAEGIISDGSFDVSGSVGETMSPFLRQLSISCDFVERQEKCKVSTLYLSGGMSLANYWVEAIRAGTSLDLRLWNPLDAIPGGGHALPVELAGQESRFAAAVGIALGALA